MTREEAIELLKRIKKGNYLGGIIDVPSDESSAFDMAIKALEQETKTGHWEFVMDTPYGPIIRCSTCKEQFKVSPEYFARLNEVEKYCHFCGAKMFDDEEESEE